MIISEIPLDVFINVCEFLNPLDVLSLGECTKQLRAFSQTRSLWISLTHDTIRGNSLHSPSFPIPKLSTRQLQQVACAPSRMIERLRHAAQAPYIESNVISKHSHRHLTNEPFINRIPRADPSPLVMPPSPLSGVRQSRYMRILRVPYMEPKALPFMSGELEFDKLCLIPGGRFLAATFGDEAVLFDLGVAGYTCIEDGQLDDEDNISKENTGNRQPPIYARWQHRGDDFFMPGPSSDGNEVRLAMGGSLDNDDHYDPANTGTLSIVRIWEEEGDPSSEGSPSICDKNTSKVRSVRVVQHDAPLPQNHASRVTFFTIVGDLFVYAYDSRTQFDDSQLVTNRIHVWNFIEDGCVEWEIPEGDYKELFIDGDFIVMVVFPDIVGWKIPPLRPRRSRTTASPSSHPTTSYNDIVPLPSYPPTFKIPFIVNPRPHLTPSDPEFDDYNYLSQLGDSDYNPLNNLDTMIIGRLLDWYNLSTKVTQFDAAFARLGHYGFWSFGLEGWNGDIVHDVGSGSVSVPGGGDGKSKPDVGRVVLDAAMYFKGDIANGVGLVVDPYRTCDGYTVKNVVASDGRVYVMVHDQRSAHDFQHAGVEDGGWKKPKSLGEWLWMPKRIVTLELGIPGDDDREKRRGTPDDSDDEERDNGGYENDDDGDYERNGAESSTAGIGPEYAEDKAPGNDDDEGDEKPGPSVHYPGPSGNRKSFAQAKDAEDEDEELPSIPDAGRVRGRSDISFDPCMGRFCFMDKGRKMIGIVDYLRWG